MFNESLPTDLERQGGPKVGEHYYINKEDVTVSDLSRGVSTAIEMAVDDQVYLGQLNLEDQVHIVGLDQLNQNKEEGSGSSDTIDADEPMPLIKSPPPVSRNTSLSSLTNDLSRTMPNAKFVATGMMNQTMTPSENESSFDERYTYNHPPLSQPTLNSTIATGWPSIASTRTPEEDKVEIDMLTPGRNREIASIGYSYLKDLTRGPDERTVESLSGKTSKSRCSIGFLTYARDRYVGSSTKKKVLIWSFFGALTTLLAISLAVGFAGSTNRGAKQDTRPLFEELPQTGNSSLESLRDVPPGVVLSSATGDDAVDNASTIESGVYESGSATVSNDTISTLIPPTTSNGSINPNQFRDNEGLNGDLIPSNSPIEKAGPVLPPHSRRPTSGQSTMTSLSPSKQPHKVSTPMPTAPPSSISL